MAQRYLYPPLQSSKQQIRLLTLLPGEFSTSKDASPIEVEFRSISLTDSKIPKYEALSYVWGVERSPSPVIVKSRPMRRSFLRKPLSRLFKANPQASELSFVEVTQNLATALVYLRHRTEPRVLWIDALCINQDDIEERNRQVIRMADVFHLAHRVLVWLGPENVEDRSSEALSTLHDIGSRIEVDWSKNEMRPTDNRDPSWAERNVPFPTWMDESKLGPILMLIKRPWFERVWVQQEIALANDNAILVCGHDFIIRWQLTKAIFCLHTKSFSINNWDQLSLFRDRLDLVHTMVVTVYKHQSLEYANVLRDQARTLKCLDPRDRIFALLSISSIWERGVIEADYSKTTEEVYRDFAINHILHTNKLRLVTACEGEGAHNGLRNPIPSWVPDWRRPIVPTRLHGLLASGRTPANAQFDHKKEILTVTGVKFATVTRVNPTFMSLVKAGFELTKGIQECIQFWRLPEKYLTGEDAHDVHVQTFCGNQFSHRYKPPASKFLKYEDSSSALDYFLTNDLEDGIIGLIPSTHINRFAGRLLAVCQGRSCFATAEGYIGIGPAKTQPGDIICVLLGCDVPMVLRPNGEKRFSIVGECYCHGIMDGTALFGPLPAGFELVLTYVPKWKAHYAAFMNRQNGRMQGEDPRVAGYPLPPRWRNATTEEDGIEVYFIEDSDDGTRKRRTSNFDPRMAPEELKKRGIDIRIFELV